MNRKVKKALANILTFIVIILGIGIVYYVIKGYFIMGVADGHYYDGWGRTLYEPPFWVKIVWPNMQWPGLKWFLIDTIGFWISAAIFAGLVSLSGRLRNQ